MQGVINYTGITGSANSPLAKLLQSRWECWRRVNSSDDRPYSLAWLEHANPETVSVATETDEELAATLDSLDLILVSAIEEAEKLKKSELVGANLETDLGTLWSHLCTIRRH